MAKTSVSALQTPRFVLCDGMREGDYCDCSGDCTHKPEFCACEAARACCEVITIPGQDHHPGPGRRLQDPFHSPPPGHLHEASPSPSWGISAAAGRRARRAAEAFLPPLFATIGM